MNPRSRPARVLLAAIVLALILPGTAIAKRPGGETATNNLSFPAIAVDGFAITRLAEPSFTVPYTGSYPGLTDAEIAALALEGPWYAQKVTGNQWQAEYANQGAVDVTYIDWSDNMESVSPKVRAPFRIEMVLFQALETPMTAYKMAVLEYPSSADELQGANTTTYASQYATVISGKPKLGIQFLGASVPADLSWTGTQWTRADETVPTVVPISFAPELNVGGKYIFGASSGGWKPSQAGYYRITFWIPADSTMNLTTATIANESSDFGAPTEGVATAVLDTANNLTYIDVLVTGGGGRR